VYMRIARQCAVSIPVSWTHPPTWTRYTSCSTLPSNVQCCLVATRLFSCGRHNVLACLLLLLRRARLCLWIWASNGPCCLSMGHRSNTDKEKTKDSREKSGLVPFCPPQTPHDCFRDEKSASNQPPKLRHGPACFLAQVLSTLTQLHRLYVNFKQYNDYG
jgi:hypothetical protein